MASQGGQVDEGVVGVRVVHNHSERLTGTDGLEAAGNGLKLRNELDQIGKRDAASVGRGEGRQQIENVHLAGQPRGDFGRACRGFQFEHCA